MSESHKVLAAYTLHAYGLCGSDCPHYHCDDCGGPADPENGEPCPKCEPLPDPDDDGGDQ